MAQPTTTPRWSDDGAATPNANVVEPTELRKDAGWAAADRAPAQYFNWLLYWIIAWILWFKERVGAGTNVTLQIGAGQFLEDTSSAWGFDGVAWVTSDTTGDVVSCTVTLPRGARVKGVRVFLQHAVATAGLLQARLKVYNMSTGDTPTSLSDLTNSAASTGFQQLALTTLVEHTLADNEKFVVSINTAGASGTDRNVFGLEFDYDIP